MKKLIALVVAVLLFLPFYSCEKEETPNTHYLILKFKFDPTQERLNNLGQIASVPTGHAAQSPVFNTISSHYVELAPTANTQLGQGTILYHAPETIAGGANAIDFNQAKVVAEDEVFLKIPLKQVAAGSYQWMRVSLSYQNYRIAVRHSGADYLGTLASFVGFKTYITNHSIGNNFFTVNGNRAQGYWAFALNDFPYSSSGQAPEGATTVPNPLAATSPIPAGSCVVTGQFAVPLQISGNETNDVVVTMSLSTNQSFEWIDTTPDGKYEPSAGESVVDMGLRGLIPTYVK
ncbi:hypothetical protein [Flavobacterium sp.]|jgi:hypothetical protein|uniref:hypothetical protein n=1 Tax=Flavobacterium sp. TaxID=239 RepID=UPI0026187F2F|nr:hypothetical protein [Flavobacterium sp.]